MTTIFKILGVFTDIYEFFKKHPKFFLGVIVAIFIMLFFKQCDDNRKLKNEIEILNVELENENNRSVNNINALNDTIQKLGNTNNYIKGVLRIKEGETQLLTDRLRNETEKVEDLTKKLKDAEIKNVYITDVITDITTSDITTNVTATDSNTFSLGVSDSTSVYSINTETWFKLVPLEDKLQLQLLDKFGDNKSSLLDYKLNFTLSTSQIELPDGNTRILIRPTDRYGNEIPSDILSIPFSDGVDFVDVKPQIITPPNEYNKRRIGITIGPTAGLSYSNQVFVPTLGIGVTVGYRIW